MFEAGLFLRAVFSKRRQHTLLHRNWAKARFPGHMDDDDEVYEIRNTNTSTKYKYEIQRKSKRRPHTLLHRKWAKSRFSGLTDHDDQDDD